MKKILVSVLLLLSGGVWGQNCSECANQLIEKQKIQHLSTDHLRLLINEVYARKGYVFKDYRYANYFENQSWYKPLNQNNSIQLNHMEEQNVGLLKGIIQEKEAQREKIINQLKALKKITQSGQWEALKDFGFSKNQESGELTDYAKQALQRVLHKIDLQDIHFYQKQGIYQIQMDNGAHQEHFSLSISEQSVRLSLSVVGYSQLVVKEEKPLLQYRSEEIEVGYYWEFEFKNKQLVLLAFSIAG